MTKPVRINLYENKYQKKCVLLRINLLNEVRNKIKLTLHTACTIMAICTGELIWSKGDNSVIMYIFIW